MPQRKQSKISRKKRERTRKQWTKGSKKGRRKQRTKGSKKGRRKKRTRPRRISNSLGKAGVVNTRSSLNLKKSTNKVFLNKLIKKSQNSKMGSIMGARKKDDDSTPDIVSIKVTELDSEQGKYPEAFLVTSLSEGPYTTYSGKTYKYKEKGGSGEIYVSEDNKYALKIIQTPYGADKAKNEVKLQILAGVLAPKIYAANTIKNVPIDIEGQEETYAFDNNSVFVIVMEYLNTHGEDPKWTPIPKDIPWRSIVSSDDVSRELIEPIVDFMYELVCKRKLVNPVGDILGYTGDHLFYKTKKRPITASSLKLIDYGSFEESTDLDCSQNYIDLLCEIDTQLMMSRGEESQTEQAYEEINALKDEDIIDNEENKEIYGMYLPYLGKLKLITEKRLIIK